MQVVRKFCAELADAGRRVRFFIRDRYTKFTAASTTSSPRSAPNDPYPVRSHKGERIRRALGAHCAGGLLGPPARALHATPGTNRRRVRPALQPSPAAPQPRPPSAPAEESKLSAVATSSAARPRIRAGGLTRPSHESWPLLPPSAAFRLGRGEIQRTCRSSRSPLPTPELPREAFVWPRNDLVDCWNRPVYDLRSWRAFRFLVSMMGIFSGAARLIVDFRQTRERRELIEYCTGPRCSRIDCPAATGAAQVSDLGPFRALASHRRGR
jgi:hypothetical protein